MLSNVQARVFWRCVSGGPERVFSAPRPLECSRVLHLGGRGPEKMALSLTNSYSSVSSTSSDNTLVGLFNNQLVSSRLNLISLSSQTVTTILAMQYLDALQVTYRMIFCGQGSELVRAI